MSRREQATRRILNGAVADFAKRGHPGTSIEQIGQPTGWVVPKGSLQP